MNDLTGATQTNRRPRYTLRRVSDCILIAFHQACDQGDFEIAEQLLAVLAMAIAGRRDRPTAPDRRNKESLVAAYERLWELRHPDLTRAHVAKCAKVTCFPLSRLVNRAPIVHHIPAASGGAAGTEARGSPTWAA